MSRGIFGVFVVEMQTTVANSIGLDPEAVRFIAMGAVHSGKIIAT